MRRSRFAVALALALALPLTLAGGRILPAVAFGQSTADRCEVPAELLNLGAPLPRTAKLLRSGEPLTIVAFGSSSTFGTGASDPSLSYPSRLEGELRQRFPAASLRVLNRGVGGDTEKTMLERIDIDVLSEKPDLVIWQVGANAVLRGDPTRADAVLMREGVLRLKASGADLMLMDLQYAPALMLRPRHKDMLRVTAHLARTENVALFRRFAVMRSWAEEAGVPLKSILAADHLHMNDRSYGCLGGLVADSIAAATGGLRR